MLPTLVRHQRECATHPIHGTHASTPPTPAKLARFTCNRTTHGTHASTNNTPFLKLVLKLPPRKNCHFQNFDLYFDQKIVIIKRHIQVYITCYSKCGTCSWMSSWTLLYITFHIFKYISWMLNNSGKSRWTGKTKYRTYKIC